MEKLDIKIESHESKLSTNQSIESHEFASEKEKVTLLKEGVDNINESYDDYNHSISEKFSDIESLGLNEERLENISSTIEQGNGKAASLVLRAKAKIYELYKEVKKARVGVALGVGLLAGSPVAVGQEGGIETMPQKTEMKDQGNKERIITPEMRDRFAIFKKEQMEKISDEIKSTSDSYKIASVPKEEYVNTMVEKAYKHELLAYKNPKDIELAEDVELFWAKHAIEKINPQEMQQELINLYKEKSLSSIDFEDTFFQAKDQRLGDSKEEVDQYLSNKEKYKEVFKFQFYNIGLKELAKKNPEHRIDGFPGKEIIENDSSVVSGYLKESLLKINKVNESLAKYKEYMSKNPSEFIDKNSLIKGYSNTWEETQKIDFEKEIGILKQKKILLDTYLNPENFFKKNDADKLWLVQNTTSEAYLSKLMMEGYSEKEARDIQQKQLSSLEDDYDLDFSSLGYSKWSPESDKVTLNVYDSALNRQVPHEYRHKITEGAIGMSEYAKESYNNGLISKENFEDLKNTKTTDSEWLSGSYEYYTNPSELDARKKTLEQEMEELHIKKYGEVFNESHYKKLKDLYENDELSRNSREIFGLLKKENLINILNTIAEAKQEDLQLKDSRFA